MAGIQDHKGLDSANSSTRHKRCESSYIKILTRQNKDYIEDVFDLQTMDMALTMSQEAMIC